MTLTSFLDISQTPEKADCIFVFAGREERKRFGWKLFRKGYAPRIIFSVGRFEWRRFADLGLPSDGGLVDMVQTIDAPKRHFFVELEGERASCRWVPPGRYGTFSEARALASLLGPRDASAILVVSSGIHLRRCRLALRAFLSPRNKVIPVSSGPGKDSAATEFVKLTGYRFLSALARSPDS